MRYASHTTVSAEKSRAEIETILKRYGANSFAYAAEGRLAMIGFQVGKKRVRFMLPLPDPTDKEFTEKRTRGGNTKMRSDSQATRLLEQSARARWRALALCIKAKLEAVESGITNFELEFLAHLVTPGGKTLGEIALPQYEKAIESGKPLPPMLTM
mgnify:CR=1 FL=1